MSNSKPLSIGALLAGAFGGIAANLVSLANDLIAGTSAMPNGTYFIGLLMFAAMGAALDLLRHRRSGSSARDSGSDRVVPRRGMESTLDLLG